jgi:hypothetical protein
MCKYASKVIEQAQNWLGKSEKDGSFKVIIDTYNAHKPLARGYNVKYTDEWCATFVSAVAIKLRYTDIIPTECGCEKMIGLLKEKGVWVENESYIPKPADIIFYDWQDNGVGDNKGYSDHVGIVEKVSGNTITIIEGNKDAAVERRTIEVNGKYIRGYGVPKYDAEPIAKKSNEAIAKEVLEGKWGNGQDRINRLTSAGYNYNAIQNIVNAINKPTTPKVNYFAKYNGTSASIVSALNSIGATSSFAYRKKIASANGIKLYAGTSKQNITMLNLLKQGKLIKP